MINILDEVKDAASIAIGGHIRPDGDCVGSCLGMWKYLKNAFPEKKIDVYLEETPAVFDWMVGIDRIKRPDGTKHNYDMFIALDCNAERLGDAEPIFRGAKKRINIDHHITNAGEGEINYVVPTASSASELVYDTMSDKQYIDKDIAMAIYTGIVHDTGVFQYSSVAPKTLRTAAELIEYGFDFTALIEDTFYEKTYVQNQVMGRTVMESTLFQNGHCIIGHLDSSVMKLYGVTSKDMDGIVNQLRYTKGVDCAVFTYEIAPGDYKVSLRSNGVVDCSKVAQYFGGGGHVRASGCSINGTFQEVFDKIAEEIGKQY